MERGTQYLLLLNVIWTPAKKWPPTSQTWELCRSRRFAAM